MELALFSDTGVGMNKFEMNFDSLDYKTSA